jgi:CRISPR-associated protein Cas5t
VNGVKALRIKIRQASANYRKEETTENKMTYPLPPLSTVSGALHSICGYTEYKKMDISIQGKFSSMRKKVYRDYCFLNSTMDDRGTLVKMKNESMLSNAFTKVASAKKSQGNSFFNGTTIQVHDESLLQEYRDLKVLGNKIAEWKSTEYKERIQNYKQEKNRLAEQKKTAEKGSNEYDEIVQKEKQIKAEEKEWKKKVSDYETSNYKIPISKFRSLTTSIKYYEILDNVQLILHIRAEEEVLNDIYHHIYDLKSLGRSEDFVEVTDAELVELLETYETVRSPYSAYLHYDDVKNRRIYTGMGPERLMFGTKYYLGKKYEIQDGKRIFIEKIPVVYTSDFKIRKTSENIWIDDQKNIVNFL